MGTRAGACLRLAVLVTCVCTNAVTMAQELVRFESAPVRVGQLQQRLARERGEAPKTADTIEGYLAKPEGDGPFAAIVSLHGCDGLSKDDRKSIAQSVTGLGYVSLAVDSFATRGIKDACTKPMPALMLARQGDALGALSYLSKLPFVDPQRIAVLGGSMGATVALELASPHHVETFDAPRDLKFKAAVAYFPACGFASEELVVSTLILIGELDDWLPARDCELWMKRRADRGAPVKLVVYPGAYHAFSVPAFADGREMYGHWLKYDAEAARKAVEETQSFLSVQFSR
ncbi:dienelactone hydrolase family protein [Bradyrhizobium commune]|uniref:Dienelactone hydrolase family protein n=2 Tax=Bradyrhizobium commune TaxID=83627 RepID=A0A7S9D4C8_9BRAD|nr:dienelactone hydrolase family protein [Bradyrhizobium commune]